MPCLFLEQPGKRDCSQSEKRGGGEGNEVRELKGGAKSYIALKVLVKDLSFTLDNMKNHWHCLFLWRERKPLKNLSSDTM